ncbi:MAG: hypothetical protein GX801_02540, partial [Fibrobacter sp.]|nr:hypothetical protein [Fibrobacter sp.]
AREQGFYNADVIAAEEGYIEMAYQNCAAFFEVADAFANSPRLDKKDLIEEFLYDGLAKEDAEMLAEDEVAAYDEEIELKVNTAREAGVPKCATGIKASQHYQIDNQWTQKLFELVRDADPENEALSIKIVKFDPTTLFRDTRYFRTKARLEQIAASEVMTAQEQIKTYNDIIKEAKADNKKLKAELAQLQKRLRDIEAENTPTEQ